jgi:hypothetical protein
MILEIIACLFAFVLGALAMALYLFVRPATLLKWRREVADDLRSAPKGKPAQCTECGYIEPRSGIDPLFCACPECNNSMRWAP